MPSRTAVGLTERVERSIVLIRGQRVLLDAALAALYGVPTRILVQSVKRNLGRFPDDFMFRLTPAETARLRSQIVISNAGRGGRRSAPYVFTEQGVAMLSSVLRSPRAVHVNVTIMRTFVRLRRWLASNEALTRRLNALEKRYDARFKVVFDAIRDLMMLPAPVHRAIGFRPRAPHDDTAAGHDRARRDPSRPRLPPAGRRARPRTFPSPAPRAAGRA